MRASTSFHGKGQAVPLARMLPPQPPLPTHIFTVKFVYHFMSSILTVKFVYHFMSIILTVKFVYHFMSIIYMLLIRKVAVVVCTKNTYIDMP